ncbi:MAG: type II toxin-antitoxin system MqsA family antitoxin [Thermodesulfobacteriota bacterium]|nr:type II toxin-antitoxin system MqsA family antitoxin [Thermodesulfobacteriota bacterium]
MYKDGNKCPVCGSGTLTKKTIEEVFDYKGETLTIKDYVIYECSVCEESIVDRKTLADTEDLLIEFRRKVDNLLTPNEIREIRTLFGHTQEAFGTILGGGKKAFARYENGTITQSRAMDNQLKMLRSNPEILNAIVKKLPDNIKTSRQIDYSNAETPYPRYWSKGQSFFTSVTNEEEGIITSSMSTTVGAPNYTQPQLIKAEAA